MEPTRRNGLRNGENEEDIILEDDLLEVVELEPNSQDGDMVNELDMLGVEEEEEEEEEDDGQEMEAAAMAMTPSRDDAKVTFTKHSGSVFCVDVARAGSDVAVTGGEDDKAYVWDINSGDVLIECNGHKDSVTCVGCSHDGKYIATGDLGGFIQVWSTTQHTAVWSFEVSDLEWLHWHPSAPVLLAGTVDGDMWMWKIPGGECKTFQSFGRACNVGEMLGDGKRVVAGYEDGSVRIWDLKAATPLNTLSGNNGHQGSITSLCSNQDDTVVITGSTDCTALLLNTTSGKVLGRLQCQTSNTGVDENSVESVGLSHVLPFAATGTLSGSLCIWDVPTQVCRLQCSHEAGIVKLCWHQSQPMLYTCSLDGAVQLWDARSGKREREWLGHEAPILDLQITRNGDKCITTSDDHTARVFHLT